MININVRASNEIIVEISHSGVEDNFRVFASNRFIEWFEWWTLEIFYLDDILQRRLSTVGPTLKRR